MGTIPELQTFAPLWKLYMNRTPLPQAAPLVGTPKRASSELIYQATRQLLKGTDRKSVMRSLATSTARKPAAVMPAPAAAPAAAAPAPAAPSPGAAPSLPGPASGFGGAGYSGNVATALEHPSNPGFTTATPPPPPHP